jgi:hypothetical protein
MMLGRRGGPSMASSPLGSSPPRMSRPLRPSAEAGSCVGVLDCMNGSDSENLLSQFLDGELVALLPSVVLPSPIALRRFCAAAEVALDGFGFAIGFEVAAEEEGDEEAGTTPDFPSAAGELSAIVASLQSAEWNPDQGRRMNRTPARPANHRAFQAAVFAGLPLVAVYCLYAASFLPAAVMHAALAPFISLACAATAHAIA